MKKTSTVLASALLVAALGGFSNAQDEPRGDARANLHQINKSGAKGKVVFMQSGSDILAVGVARGLQPGQNYVSLLYDPATVPSGPAACTPVSGPPAFVGQWTTADENGNATLNGTVQGASLDNVGTMSIRLASTFALQACGRVDTSDE